MFLLLSTMSFCADSFCRASSRKMISSSIFVFVVVFVFVLFFFFVLLSLLMCYRSSFFFFFLLFFLGALFRLVDIFLLTVFLSLSLFTHTHFCTTGLSLKKKKFLFAFPRRSKKLYILSKGEQQIIILQLFSPTTRGASIIIIKVL